MQHESPLLQDPALWLLALKAHLQDPGPPGVLAPGVGGHEGPLVEAHPGVVVAGPSAQQDGLCAHGRGHVDVEVAAAGRVDSDDRLDVLQVADKVVLPLAGFSGDGQHLFVARLDFTAKHKQIEKVETIKKKDVPTNPDRALRLFLNLIPHHTTEGDYCHVCLFHGVIQL